MTRAVEPEFNALAGDDVTAHNSVQHNVGHRDAAFDGRLLGNAERGTTVRIGVHAAFHDTIDMTMTGKPEVAVYLRINAHQSVYLIVRNLLATKHYISPNGYQP